MMYRKETYKILFHGFAFTLLACSLVSDVARGEESGWSWGPLSSKTKTSPTGAVESKSSTSWVPDWKMPDVAGGIQKTGKVVSDKTAGAWNSTTRATKKAWKKTAEVLAPFPDEKPLSNSSPWASGDSSSSSKSSSKGGMFSWMSRSKVTDEKPSSPSDFLRQKRP